MDQSLKWVCDSLDGIMGVTIIMSGREGDSEKHEAAERPPERGTEAAQRESMGGAVDHLERTRAQAAHQKDTENRLPKPTTRALGRPEIVGDDGKVLVKGAEPHKDANRDNLRDGDTGASNRDGDKGASHSADGQARIAQAHTPLNSFLAGRIDATADQGQKVMNAAESGELSADEAISRLQNLNNEVGHLKDLKGMSRGAATTAAEAAEAAPKVKEGEAPAAGQSEGTGKQDDSGASTPSKELMDAYGGQNPDALWKQMGATADQIDGMPAGPEKDAKARQYNDMNNVYQYLRSRQ